MRFGKALEGVKQAITRDDVAADDPFLRLMVKSRLSFCCVLECPNRGNPITHHDPSPAQLAAFWSKPNALNVIRNVSREEGVTAEEFFCPTTSNTSAKLLVLAVQNPDQQIDSLRFLIEEIRGDGISIDSCTAYSNTAHSNTALFEAVEMRNAKAFQLLIANGADPLYDAEKRLCPLVRAVFLDRTLVAEILKERDERATWFGRTWNPETLLADPNGKALSEILVGRGFDALGQFVRDLDARPDADRAAEMPIRDPTAVVEEEEEDANSSAQAAYTCTNCESTTDLRKCDGCGKIFCADHFDDHSAECPGQPSD
jgi:hypothetical protein